jgi:hypothetical protein
MKRRDCRPDGEGLRCQAQKRVTIPQEWGSRESFRIRSVRSNCTFFLIQDFFCSAFILVKMKHHGPGKSSLHSKDSACDM